MTCEIWMGGRGFDGGRESGYGVTVSLERDRISAGRRSWGFGTVVLVVLCTWGDGLNI